MRNLPAIRDTDPELSNVVSLRSFSKGKKGPNHQYELVNGGIMIVNHLDGRHVTIHRNLENREQAIQAAKAAFHFCREIFKRYDIEASWEPRRKAPTAPILRLVEPVAEVQQS